MEHEDLRSRIDARLARAGLTPAEAQTQALAAYLTLLARWNRKINLTALAVDPPTDAALDRLLVEPLQAARHVRPTDRLALDVGSGGGSPALPLKIAASSLSMALVESRVRKAAFLREAARQLGLTDVEVHNDRLERLCESPAVQARFDLVTLRAVRADEELWRCVSTLLRAGGRVLWFRSETEGPDWPAAPWRVLSDDSLLGERSRLVVLSR